MELCQTRKDSNKLFVDAMLDMSKSFMLMAETMKISMQQMTMIQQQQQQHSVVSVYQPTHHSHNKHSNDRYFTQCTSTKYNECTNTNNVNERTTTYNECTATNNELAKSCNK